MIQLPQALHRAQTALLIAALGCAACNGVESSEEISMEGEALYFEPIGYGPSANISDTTEIAIYSRDEWLTATDSLFPIAPFDSVDFSQAVVLLAALPQITSGYSIEFRSVEVRDTIVVAEYLVNMPSEDCLTSAADAVPFQAVLVRRTELPVHFERHVEEYRCTFGPRRR